MVSSPNEMMIYIPVKTNFYTERDEAEVGGTSTRMAMMYLCYMFQFQHGALFYIKMTGRW